MLGHYLENSFIIDITSTTYRGALSELLSLCPLPKSLNRESLLDELLLQESTVSSYLGQGIALPHLKVNMRKSYLLVLGRVRTPLKDPSIHTGEQIQLIVLFLAASNVNVDNYLTLLATFAKFFQALHLPQHWMHVSLEELKTSISLACKNISIQRKSKRGNIRFNRLILRESIKIATAGNCSAIFLFKDTFDDDAKLNYDLHTDLKTIIVTHRTAEILHKDSIWTLPVQLVTGGRLAQLRSAILLALIHRYIGYNEKICCIGGLPYSNRLDTIVIADVNQEVQSVFSQQTDILPPNVLPEVFERLLTIATELATEGREGKSIGCMFVLGDVKTLEPYIHPLILNPFRGYGPEERNLLNPFIDETIKEYSLLDGAFVIGGNGIVESAGSLIHSTEQIQLPGGLGTRHAAAVAVSNAVDCIAITISSSTGQVSLFRKGKMLPLFDKGIGCSNTEV